MKQILQNDMHLHYRLARDSKLGENIANTQQQKKGLKNKDTPISIKMITSSGFKFTFQR